MSVELVKADASPSEPKMMTNLAVVHLVNVLDDLMKRSLPSVGSEMKIISWKRHFDGPARDFMTLREKGVTEYKDDEAKKEAFLVELLNTQVEVVWPKTRLKATDFPMGPKKPQGEWTAAETENVKGMSGIRLFFEQIGLSDAVFSIDEEFAG